MAEQRLRNRRFLRTCLVPILALTGMAVLPADDVYASCGDYVHVNGVQPGGQPTPSGAQPLPQPPCNGPNCSRSSDPAPLAPTAPPETTPKDWAGVLSNGLIVELAVNAWLEGHPRVCPIYRPSPPDRPPRSLAAGSIAS